MHRRFCMYPKICSIGNSSAFLPRAEASGDTCGNALISSNWETNTYCLYLLWEQASGPAYIWSAISATRQENSSTTSAVKRTGDSIFMHHSHSLMEKAEDLSSDGQTVGIGCHSGKTGARPIGKAGADFSLCQER